MLETLVERLVIRGDDPREPHASDSWMKIRAMAVAIAPAIVAIGALRAIDAPVFVTWVVPLVVVLVSVKLVTRPINERIEELERTEKEGEPEQ